jgi:hypothetical protein
MSVMEEGCDYENKDGFCIRSKGHDGQHELSQVMFSEKIIQLERRIIILQERLVIEQNAVIHLGLATSALLKRAEDAEAKLIESRLMKRAEYTRVYCSPLKLDTSVR